MKTIIFILVVWTGFVFGEKPILVSLGADCGAANYSKIFGYRLASFPLDWYLSLDSDAVIEMLDENFRDFLEPQYLMTHSGGLLIHTRYHLIFSREGSWNPQKMPEFRERLERRIERFRNLNTYQGKVFFVRLQPPPYETLNLPFPSKPLEMSEDYAIRLKSALRRFFPDLNFALIIINWQPEKSVRIEDNLFIFNNLQEVGQMITMEEMHL